MKKKLFGVMLVVVMLANVFTAHAKAESMADLATSISTFEVLKDVKIDEKGTNFYSIDSAEKGTLTFTTSRKNNDYLSINVYNEGGECVYSNPYPDSYVGRDVQEISLNKGMYIISIYSAYGRSYDLTTSFNKSTEPELIMEATIKRGKSIQLSATLTEGSEKITWKSNKASVVKVTSNGLVAGVKKGSAIITATSQSGLSTKLKIVVTE